MKRFVAVILCLVLLLGIGFRRAAVLRERMPSVSLRFDTPVAQAQVDESRTWSQTTCAPWASGGCSTAAGM